MPTVFAQEDFVAVQRAIRNGDDAALLALAVVHRESMQARGFGSAIAAAEARQQHREKQRIAREEAIRRQRQIVQRLLHKFESALQNGQIDAAEAALRGLHQANIQAGLIALARSIPRRNKLLASKRKTLESKRQAIIREEHRRAQEERERRREEAETARQYEVVRRTVEPLLTRLRAAAVAENYDGYQLLCSDLDSVDRTLLSRYFAEQGKDCDTFLESVETTRERLSKGRCRRRRMHPCQP